MFNVHLIVISVDHNYHRSAPCATLNSRGIQFEKRVHINSARVQNSVTGPSHTRLRLSEVPSEARQRLMKKAQMRIQKILWQLSRRQLH